jgi:hypothetical protein
MPPSPSQAKRSGTVSMVNASGWQSATSSQASGVETRASVGRTEYAGPPSGPGVLVVVHEHAVPFFLPPLRGGQVWCPAFHLPGQGHRGPADLGEVPAALDPGVDVEAARAGCLGPAGQPEVGQHGLTSATDDLRPFTPAPGPGRPELVGMVKVVGPTGCGLRSMQPRLTAQIRVAASRGQPRPRCARTGSGSRVDPRRARLRRPLRKNASRSAPFTKRLSTIGRAGNVTIAPSATLVVPDQVKLGVPGTREKVLAGLRWPPVADHLRISLRSAMAPP